MNNIQMFIDRVSELESIDKTRILTEEEHSALLFYKSKVKRVMHVGFSYDYENYLKERDQKLSPTGTIKRIKNEMKKIKVIHLPFTSEENKREEITSNIKELYEDTNETPLIIFGDNDMNISISMLQEILDRLDKIEEAQNTPIKSYVWETKGTVKATDTTIDGVVYTSIELPDDLDEQINSITHELKAGKIINIKNDKTSNQ